MYSHLVAVKVCIKGGAYQGVKLNSAAVNKHWLKSLNTKTVKCGRAVKHHRTFFDNFFQDVINFAFCTFNKTAGAFNIGGQSLADKAAHDERFEKFKGHPAWQTALMEAGFSLAPYGADGSFGPLSQRQTDAFKTAAGLAIDSPVTVCHDDWLGMVRYMAGKVNAAELAAAQDRATAAEKRAQEQAAYALTIKAQYNKLANAALVIRDAIPM